MSGTVRTTIRAILFRSVTCGNDQNGKKCEGEDESERNDRLFMISNCAEQT